MVTVVRRVRPSSATVGDKAIVTADGEMKGFVGGHCTRDLVIDQAKKCLRTGESKLRAGDPAAADRRGGRCDGSADDMRIGRNGRTVLGTEKCGPTVGGGRGFPHRARLGRISAAVFSLTPRRISLEEARNPRAEGPVATLRNQLHFHANTPAYGVVATMGLYDVDGLLAVASLPLRYLGLVTSPKRWTRVRADLAGSGASSRIYRLCHGACRISISAPLGRKKSHSVCWRKLWNVDAAVRKHCGRDSPLPGLGV